MIILDEDDIIVDADENRWVRLPNGEFALIIEEQEDKENNNNNGAVH